MWQLFSIRARVVHQSGAEVNVKPSSEDLLSILVSSTATEAERLRWIFDLGISANRASYGQLTEGGPTELSESLNYLKTFGDGQASAVSNHSLGAHIESGLQVNGRAVQLRGELPRQFVDRSPLSAQMSAWVDASPGSDNLLVATYRLYLDTHLRGTLTG